MARAICEKCGETVRWSAGRGSRLADLRHTECGGSLRSLTAGQSRRPGPIRTCAACGRELRGRAAIKAGWASSRDLYERRIFVCASPSKCEKPDLRQKVLDCASSFERYQLLVQAGVSL